MSNAADLLEELGAKNALGVGLFGGVAGIFADLAGVIEIVNLLSKNHDIENALADIQNALREAFSQLHADDRAQRILDREGKLADAYALSDSVLGTLKADMAADLDWAARSDRIQKCIQAVDKLDYNEQFMSLFDDEIYYEDWWSGRALGPTPDAALVFTDRYSLPAYMRAVYAFILVIRAFDPNFRGNNQVSIRKYADRLTRVHDTSAGGVRLMPIPAWDSATCQWAPGDGGTPFLVYLAQTSTFREGTPWLGAVPEGNPPPVVDIGQPFGAVHSYSGYSMRAEFPRIPNLVWTMPPPPNPALLFTRLQPKTLVASHGRRKRLYAAVGLSDLRDFIDGLHGLSGLPPGGPDPGRWWSLREAAFLLDDIGGKQIIAASQGLDFGPMGATAPLEASWWESYKLDTALGARDVIGRLVSLSHAPSVPPIDQGLSWRNALDRSLLDRPVADPLAWW